MSTPFPGVDPYVEARSYWSDFHNRFLIYLSDAIISQLPEAYEARVEARLTIAARDQDIEVRPDVTIVRDDRVETTPPRLAGGALTLEPVVIPLPTPLYEEMTERWIEIRRLEDRSVVAVVELLSPSDKVGRGREEYLAKRELLIAEPVHLVELDFLLKGQRLPMGRPLPAGDFYAIVSREERRPDAEVYAWSIRAPIPSIPIPLDPGDADLAISLGELYLLALDRARYGRGLRRDQPLNLPLAPDDLAWAEATGRG